MTINKVSSESPFYFQLIHVNNIWNIKTVFMQNGYRLQWYGIFPLFLIQYLAQPGLLIMMYIMNSYLIYVHSSKYSVAVFHMHDFHAILPGDSINI